MKAPVMRVVTGVDFTQEDIDNLKRQIEANPEAFINDTRKQNVIVDRLLTVLRAREGQQG